MLIIMITDKIQKKSYNILNRNRKKEGNYYPNKNKIFKEEKTLKWIIIVDKYFPQLMKVDNT